MKIDEYREARPYADRYLRAKEAYEYLKEKHAETDLRIEIRDQNNNLLLTHELPAEFVMQALEARMKEQAYMLKTYGVQA